MATTAGSDATIDDGQAVWRQDVCATGISLCTTSSAAASAIYTASIYMKLFDVTIYKLNAITVMTLKSTTVIVYGSTRLWNAESADAQLLI